MYSETSNNENLLNPFGIQISSVDLSLLSNDELHKMLVSGLGKYGLLVFSKQHLNHYDLLRIVSSVGKLLCPSLSAYRVPDFPALTVISNIHEEGKPIGIYDGDNEEEWHCDHSYYNQVPSVSSLYSVISAPVGGATKFVNTSILFSKFSKNIRQRIERLRALHSLAYLDSLQRKHVLDKPELTILEAELSAWHDLVVTSRFSNRKALLLGSAVIAKLSIKEEVSEEISTEFIEYLEVLCTSSKNIYTHQWNDGDFIIWDNFAVLHSASPCDSRFNRRLLYRVLAY